MPPKPDGSNMSEQSLQPLGCSSKRRRCASQLFRSLVPVLFRAPIWELPTTLVEATLARAGDNVTDETLCAQYFSPHRNKGTRMFMEREAVSFTAEVSSRSLHGNAVFLSEVS